MLAIGSARPGRGLGEALGSKLQTDQTEQYELQRLWEGMRPTNRGQLSFSFDPEDLRSCLSERADNAAARATVLAPFF